MRLDRMLANMGLGSRKKVREQIRKGLVSVNGKTIRKPGEKINPEKDIVLWNGERVVYQKYIYLMLNKPKGVLSATRDSFQPTVIDLLPEKYQRFEPFPVGRLDKDTVGLLLLTNDGKLAHELTSPKKEVEKLYYAKIEGTIPDGAAEKFSEGIVLEDNYKTKPAKLKVLKNSKFSEIHLSITEGKFHQVKRMFRAINREVIYLKRLQMGSLILDETLAEGEFRELTKEELQECLSL